MPGGCSRFPGVERTHIPPQLWVVGAGTLGRRVLLEYKDLNPLATLIAETRTPSHHTDLASIATPRCFDDAGRDLLARSTHVLFALPPSAPNYLSAIESTLQHLNNACRIVLISSTGVYDKDSTVINENSQLANSPRAEMFLAFQSISTILINCRMLAAEELVRRKGGCVLRCSGLYAANRGAHIFYSRLPVSDLEDAFQKPESVHLVHYDDAARAVLSAFQYGERSGVYVISDDATSGLSRYEIYFSAMHANLVPKRSFPQVQHRLHRYYFTNIQISEEATIFKNIETDKAKRVLHWKPMQSSFVAFCREYASKNHGTTCDL